MRCIQKKTLDLILSLNCHFLCQVKQNCRKLYETCALHVGISSPVSVFEYYEQGHGNQIYRNISLYENKITMPKGWNGIERIIKVRRWGLRAGKEFEQTAYYISSKPIYSAVLADMGIRGHWGVENLLHWTKDVHLKEDATTLRNTKQVTTLVYLNNMALNLLKMKGWKTNADTFAKISNKIDELIKLFT